MDIFYVIRISIFFNKVFREVEKINSKAIHKMGKMKRIGY